MVDANGALQDVYARSDITALCKSNAYNRLQYDDVTVGQAIALGEVKFPPFPFCLKVRSPVLLMSSDTSEHGPTTEHYMQFMTG